MSFLRGIFEGQSSWITSFGFRHPTRDQTRIEGTIFISGFPGRSGAAQQVRPISALEKAPRRWTTEAIAQMKTALKEIPSGTGPSRGLIRFRLRVWREFSIADLVLRPASTQPPRVILGLLVPTVVEEGDVSCFSVAQKTRIINGAQVDNLIKLRNTTFT